MFGSYSTTSTAALEGFNFEMKRRKNTNSQRGFVREETRRYIFKFGDARTRESVEVGSRGFQCEKAKLTRENSRGEDSVGRCLERLEAELVNEKNLDDGGKRERQKSRQRNTKLE